jgi:predicted transcriptional regulator
MPSSVNGTELSAQEYRDAFLLRYGRCPGDLPPHCDGCGQKFNVRHALECKKGGNVISRHNEIRDELADLASKAITPSAVRNEPIIHASCQAVKMTELDQDQPAVSRNLHKNRGETRGDVSIRGIWNRGTDCIIDVRVTDTDAKSNISKDPAKVLEAHEKEKKKKYLEACLEQRRTFTPFVVSTDGLIGKEAKTLLKMLSTLLAEKWGKSYSEVCGYVNARMSIAIVRATHLCLRGSRVPSSQMSNRRPQWEDKAGLSLFRH